MIIEQIEFSSVKLKKEKKENFNTRIMAKPFLKWPGGKTQLLEDIEKRLPNDFLDKKKTFFEPFIGSGAVLFLAINKFQNIEKICNQ